jgi:hypothetical protein
VYIVAKIATIGLPHSDDRNGAQVNEKHFDSEILNCFLRVLCDPCLIISGP